MKLVLLPLLAGALAGGGLAGPRPAMGQSYGDTEPPAGPSDPPIQVAPAEPVAPSQAPTSQAPAPAAMAPDGLDGAEEGGLRLAARVDVNGFATGGLQVFLRGAFGAVCSPNLGPVDADVACRQMGFVGGTTVPRALVGDVSSTLDLQFDLRPEILPEEVVAPFVLENLNCTGTEERLVDCPGAMVSPPPDPQFASTTPVPVPVCDPVRPAAYAIVACGTLTGPATGDVRLARGGADEGGNAAFGHLEIFAGGGWGSVCGNEGSGVPFTDEAANVACKQLGFSGGETSTTLSTDTRPTARRVPVLLEGAACAGTEAALAECGDNGERLGASTNQCALSDAISLVCVQDRQPGMDGALRLMGGSAGPGFEYGRLEIFLSGVWSTICDGPASFTPDAAAVACTILGYDGGAALEFKRPFTDQLEPENQVLVANLPVGLASVDCSGTEASLLDCVSSQDDVRICDTNSNFTDATVLACADSAGDCPAPGPPVEGSVRLRGGFGTPCDPVHTGFVEVFHDSEWGAICTFTPSPISTLVADVVCRQLGFPHGTLVDPTTNPADAPGDRQDYFLDYVYDYGNAEEAEEAQQTFWLSEGVSCRGTEERLVDCPLEANGGFLDNNGDCGPAPLRLTVACRTFAVPEALEAVTTPGAEEGDLRLFGQAAVDNWEVGRLELFFEGSWGQVCGNNFFKADADVACRQLGFGAGTVGPTRPSIRSLQLQLEGGQLVFPEVALARPGCSGSEERLLDCQGSPQDLVTFDLGSGSGRKASGCFDTSGPGLTIGCVRETEPGVEGAVRLVEGGEGDDPASGVGILEVFHAGAWGTVCSDDLTLLSFSVRSDDTGFPQEAAAVACRQLGFVSGDFSDELSVPEGVSLRPPWLGRIPCNGTGGAADIAECGPLMFGATGTCGATQRLSCSDSEAPGFGAPRLGGGSTDPAGAWAYGRLEISDGTSFRVITDVRFAERLGRKGTEVACNTLGFATGAQLLAGTASGIPGPTRERTLNPVGRVMCFGGEEALEDCMLEDSYDFGYEDGAGAAAVLCFDPSGCTVDEAPPSQGDVRLFKLNGINEDAATAPCDDVHFGGVEFFNDGRWGRICSQESFGIPGSAFVVDATVVCRQLGFPFGSLMDIQEEYGVQGFGREDYDNYGGPDEVVWASEVLCTGLEERLDECFFPEDFGRNVPSPPDYAPPAGDVVGIPNSPCRNTNSGSSTRGGGNVAVLAVVCRRFEIEESDVIR